MWQRIWNDPVWSKVIAGIILILVTWISAIVTKSLLYSIIMVVAMIIVMLSACFILRSPIRWEFGDYFICMGTSGGDIHFTGFQATGFNRSRTGINSIQGHLVSKIDNSISDTMHFVIDDHIVLPSDTTGIPPGASFNISVPLRDPTPLSENEFLRKWSGFRFVVDIEGRHYERSFSRREVFRQIDKFRQEVNPAPRPEVRMRKPVAIQPVTVTLQLAAPVLVHCQLLNCG